MWIQPVTPCGVRTSIHGPLRASRRVTCVLAGSGARAGAVSAGDSRNWVSRLTITVSPVAAGVCACAPRHITMASQAATMGLPICVYILSLPNSRDITRPRKFWHHGRFSFVQ